VEKSNFVKFEETAELYIVSDDTSIHEVVAEVEVFDPHDFNLKPNRNA
jgi:hypothetical protein